MLSGSQIGTLSNAIQWLIWSLGGVLLLLVASLFSLNYLMNDIEATNLAEMKAVANDTLSHKEIANVLSLTDLIAAPEKYHEQHVQVKGYLHLEFEGDAIYKRKADFLKNQFESFHYRVSFSDSLPKQKSILRYSDQYVVIKGIFHMDDISQKTIVSGRIDNIASLNTLPQKLD